jgi:iron(III) transport system permease protein
MSKSDDSLLAWRGGSVGRGPALVGWGRTLAARSGRPILFVLALAPLAVVAGLMLVILWTSVATDLAAGLGASLTLRYYSALFADPLVSTALVSTTGFVTVTVTVAMSFGLAASWLVERTDLPGKQVVYALMTAVLLFPSIFLAMGWMFLLHPRIGVLNTWLMRSFHLGAAPISIANVAGMGWVEGLGLASLAFVITSPVLRALNGALDEAATVHGIGRWRSFVHLTLPLTWPALLAAAIYIAVIAVSTFEVPAVIGLGSKIYTFSTLVYIKVAPEMGVPQYGVVGAVSVVLILVSLLLGWWYFRVIRLTHRYEVVRGRSYQPRLVPLGSRRWLGFTVLGIYFTLSFLLPLIMLIWAALLPYIQPFSLAALRHLTLQNFDRMQWGLLWRSAAHTLILMATVPTLALVFGLAISWVVVRSQATGRFFYDYVAFLPHAVPNLIFAIAMMIVALDFVPKGISFYGTIFILMSVYVLVRISLVTRVLNGALIQIHAELEEAAHVSGLRTLATLARVMIPLLMPAIANLWIWTALLTYRELTMAAFLVTQDNVTLPVLVWENWNSGDGGRAAAISLLCIALFFPMIAVYWRFRARVNIGELRA